MRIKFLGTHNTESQNSKLSSFLIDSILAVDAGSMPSELSFPEQKKIRGILLSHGHYDHIRGIPAFAFANTDRITRIFATTDTIDILNSHLLDGTIYPKLSQKESFLGKPVLDLAPVETYRIYYFDKYEIMAVPVNHALNSVGFEIKHRNGKSLFYTGDTGPGLNDIWSRINPDLIITDLTFPDRLQITAKNSGHLCSEFLLTEMLEFKTIKNYIPPIVAMHISPQYEDEIKDELRGISDRLSTVITVAHEGDEISI